MQMIKKIIALLMAFSVILGSVPVFAEETETPAEIVIDNNIEILKALEFMDAESEIYPDGEMSRALFVVSVLNVCRYATPPVMSGIMNFIDVREDMWYAPYISYAMELGIVNGADGASFYPDEAIKLQEAAKILTSAMGYDKTAQINGGYPNGYINTAGTIGLLEGLSINADAEMTNAQAAKMLVNALDSDVLVLDTSGSGDDYVTKNLLNRHDLYYGKGVVTATERTSIAGKTKLSLNEVQFDFNKIMNKGTTDVYDMLGCRVEYYYKDDDGELILMYAGLDSRGREHIVYAEDIVSYGNGFIRTQAVGEKVKNYTISSDAYILYNGKYITDFKADMLKPTLGRVRLVSNDGSDDYNVVFIEEYTNIVVNGFNTTEQTVYDKYNNKKTVEFDQRKNIRMYDLLNNELTFDDIEENDVLSVYESEDGLDIEIILNRRTDKGTVKRKTTEPEVITVGNTDYKLTSELEKYMADNNKSINVGDNLILYIDAFGYVAAYDYATGTSGEYAYIKKAYPDDNLEKTYVMLFNAKGEHLSVECAPSVKIDGKSCKGYDKIYEELESTKLEETSSADDSVIERRAIEGSVVIYKLDSEGKLNYIDTPVVKENEPETALFRTFTGYKYDEVLKTHTQATKLTYKNKTKCLNMQILLADNTPMFTVPTEKGKTFDNSYYSVKNAVSSLTKDNQYYIESYQQNPDSMFADVLVRYSTGAASSSVEENSNIAVVKSVIQGEDDGVVKTQIVAVVSGKEVTLIPEEEEIFHNIKGYGTYPRKDENDTIYTYSDFEVGDVFRYSNLGNGRVGAVHMIVGTKERRLGVGGTITKELACQQMSADNIKYKISRFVMGDVYIKNSGNIRITWNDPSTIQPSDVYSMETHKAKDYSIIIVDTKTGRKTDVRKGSVDDIMDYKTVTDDCSKVLVHTFWGDPRTIVVFDSDVEF